MWPIEARFVDKSEVAEGVLKEKHLLPLTIILSALLIISLLSLTSPHYPLGVYVVMAILLARLIAIDFRHFLLLDMYTLPLLISGILCPPLLLDVSWSETLLGSGIGLALPLALAFGVYKWKGSTAGLGGGDIKLMAACGAWVGATFLPVFIMLACVISFVVSLFAFKDNHIPFGPGLCLSLWIILIFQEPLRQYFGF